MAYIDPSLAYTAEIIGVNSDVNTANKIEKYVRNQTWKHFLWENEKSQQNVTWGEYYNVCVVEHHNYNVIYTFMCLCSYKSIQREKWGFSLTSVLCTFPAYTHHKNTIRFLLILQIITFVSIFSVLSPVCWRFRFVCFFFLLSFMLPYCFAYLRTVEIPYLVHFLTQNLIFDL